MHRPNDFIPSSPNATARSCVTRHPRVARISRTAGILLLCAASAVALFIASSASAQDAHDHHGNHPAHVHGAGKLDVAIEGNTLTVHLDSPLINLAGFEHAATSGKDKDTIKAMADTLRDAGRMFATDPAAQCKLAEVQLESAALPPALLGEKSATSSAYVAAARDGHADLDGDFAFVCATPGALATLNVDGLFQAFPGFQRIDVQLATPKKQAAFQLMPGNAAIPLQ